MQVKRPMRWTTRALGAALVMAGVAVAEPVSAADAQAPSAPPLSALPSAPLLPPESAAAAGWALENLSAVVPTVPVLSSGQFARGPTIIGDVFNGGALAVVSNGSPIASGNVIGSP